jgi:hypothetical protein
VRSSLFPNPPAFIAYDKLSKTSLVNKLNSRGVAFTLRATKFQLLELLKKDDLHVAEISNIEVEHTSREEFLEAIQAFCKYNI